jgi:hypothetical protein
MQSLWDITFELLMTTQFYHPFISVYITHLVLLRLTKWPVMDRQTRSFLSWQISTPVAIATWLLLEVLSVLMSRYLSMYILVDWCTVRLSLVELYNNGDLNLVPKKIMKKNKRRIPYREFVFIKL